MTDRIRLHVGPAPSALARDWVDNRRRFVEAARSASNLSANRDALDLLEMILGMWAVEAERSDVFDWAHELEVDVILLVGKYWLDLGRLTAEERAAIGVPPAPPHTEEFTAAVVRGMVDALRAAGPKAQPLLERLGVTD